MVVLPLSAPLKVAVSLEPGTVFGLQLVEVSQNALVAPVHAALAKGARVRPPLAPEFIPLPVSLPAVTMLLAAAASSTGPIATQPTTNAIASSGPTVDIRSFIFFPSGTATVFTSGISRLVRFGARV